MKENIFVDEELQGFDGDEDEPLLPSTSSPKLVPTSTLKAETPQPTTSSTVAVEASWVEEEIIFKQGTFSHIQKTHPSQQIICNLNERVTWSSRSAYLSFFTNTMRDFGLVFERVPFMCNNTSVISIAKNPVFHKRTKHLEVRHHFLRDNVEKRDIEMRYIDIERQLANIFAKPLDASRFVALRGEGGGEGGDWCLPSL
jgi:hypothetical protein